MKKFYGLTGTKLNIAIAVIAGIDFALFGYGIFYSSQSIQPPHLTKHRSRCNGRTSYPPIISPSFSTDRYPKSTRRKQPRPGLECPRYHRRRVHTGLLLWRCCDDMVGQHAWTKTNNLCGKLYNGSRGYIAGEFVWAAPADCGEAYHGVRQWHEHIYVSEMDIPCLSRLRKCRVPTWQAETSKSHRRGQMVMIEVRIRLPYLYYYLLT